MANDQTHMANCRTRMAGDRTRMAGDRVCMAVDWIWKHSNLLKSHAVQATHTISCFEIAFLRPSSSRDPHPRETLILRLILECASRALGISESVCVESGWRNLGGGVTSVCVIHVCVCWVPDGPQTDFRVDRYTTSHLCVLLVADCLRSLVVSYTL